MSQGIFLLSCSASSQVGNAPEAALPVCAPPPAGWEEGRDPPAHCVRSVSGRIEDLDGRALSSLNVTVCGSVCFYGATDPLGRFRVPVDTRLPDTGFTLIAHGRPEFGTVLVPLPSRPSEQIDLGRIQLPRLSGTGPRLPPDEAGGAVRSGPIELKIEAGTEWQLTFEDATDDVAGRNLQFVRVSPEKAPAFAKGAALVFALAPFDAKPSRPVAVKLWETGGLPAGASVEFVTMEGAQFQIPNRGGQASTAISGRVSADGQSIETDPGTGIDILTWIAVRAKE